MMAEASTSSQKGPSPRPANEGSSGSSFKDMNGNTPLHVAAQTGKSDIIKSLLSIGIGVNECNYNGETALCLAASNGNEEALEELLKAGANSSIKDKDGKTVWHHAASSGNAAILKLLADYIIPAKKQFSSNKLNQDGNSAQNVPDKMTSAKESKDNFHNTQSRRDPSAKESKDNSHKTQVVKETSAEESKDNSHNTQCVSIPMQTPNTSISSVREKVSWENIYTFADTLDVDSDEFSEDDDFIENFGGSFHIPYIINSYKDVKENEAELIKTKNTRKKQLNKASMGFMNLNEKDDDGFTPLHHAVASGAEIAVRRFLRKKADVNAKAHNNITPFFLVGVGGSTKIFNMLIKAGANYRTAATGGITPLHMAASWGSLPIVKKLIFIGADTNAKTFDGQTPLHIAATRFGNYLVCKELISNGADPSEVDLYGNTPFDVACITDDDEMSQLLIFHEYLDSLDD